MNNFVQYVLFIFLNLIQTDLFQFPNLQPIIEQARKDFVNLTIRASLAPRHLLFLLKGPMGPSPTPLYTIFDQVPEGPLRFLEKAGR